MSRDKNSIQSIAHVLQEDTVVSGSSIQEYQEDLRRAEKERLLSVQKRGELLDSLRSSLQKSNQPANVRDDLRQEFARIVRDGLVDDIEWILSRYQKQLQTLQSGNFLSQSTLVEVRTFSDRSSVFLEKKKMLSKVEKNIELLSKTNAKNSVSAATDLIIAKLTNTASSVRANLTELMEELLTRFETIESQITQDQDKEEQLQAFFYACLSTLDDQKRGKLIRLYQTTTQSITYEKRISFFKTLVEHLATTTPNAAKKIHSLCRKKARTFLKAGQYANAVSELCYALYLWKEEPDTYRLLANTFLRQKDEKKAYIALGEVLRLCPEDQILRRRMAEYWGRSDSIVKAIQEYRILLEAFPNDLSIRRDLGKLLFENKAYSEVLDILLPYIHTVNDDMESLKTVCFSYVQLKEWKKAVYFLKKLIQNNPRELENYQVITFAYRNLELYDEALRTLQQGIETNPNSLSLKILLNTVYQDCEMWDEALNILQPAIEAHPESASLYQSAGNILFRMGKMDDSLALLQKALENKKDDPEIYRTLARVFRKKQDNIQARKAYEKALLLQSDTLDLRQEMAAFYLESGQWKEATEVLNKNPQIRFSFQGIDI